TGVVVAVAAEDRQAHPRGVLRLVGGPRGQVVPLVARHLARLAPDADGDVGEEAYGWRHGDALSLAFDSRLTPFDPTDKDLGLVNGHVRVADEGREVVHHVADAHALVAPVPW